MIFKEIFLKKFWLTVLIGDQRFNRTEVDLRHFQQLQCPSVIGVLLKRVFRIFRRTGSTIGRKWTKWREDTDDELTTISWIKGSFVSIKFVFVFISFIWNTSILSFPVKRYSWSWHLIFFINCCSYENKEYIIDLIFYCFILLPVSKICSQTKFLNFVKCLLKYY